MVTVDALTFALSPQGHLYLQAPSTATLPKADQKLITAFLHDEGEGFILLANQKPADNWSPTLHFWYEFSALYVRALCQISPEETAIKLPTQDTQSANFDKLLLRLPPMLGAEYASTDTFVRLWEAISTFVEAQLSKHTFGNFLSAFLSRWQQVGRVCFHLAENKNDPTYPFAFIATYASHLSKNSKISYLPLNRALQDYAGAGNKQVLINLLKPIHAAAKEVAWVKKLLDSHDIYHPLRWTARQAYSLLKSVPKLEASGIVVRLPDWWKKRPKPKVQVSIGSAGQGALDMRTILDFGVDMVLGDEALSDEEIQRLLGSEDGLVSFRGQWVEVDKEKLQEALAHWQKAKAEAEDGVSFIEGMRLLAGAGENLSPEADGFDMSQSAAWSEVTAGPWLADILQQLRDPARVQNSTPKALTNATLRPYQQTGVNWLHFLSELGLGACLADDMGLGKTIQIIALLLLRKEVNSMPKRSSLLVLPASLLSNWKSELAKFAPSLVPFFLHPSESSRTALDDIAAHPEQLHTYDVVLTTYSILWRQTWLQEAQWDRVILDEAQAIKNPTAKQTRAIKALKAKARIALTGTPIENRVGDLWSLFDFLSPGLLGSAKVFKDFIKQLNSQEETSYEPLRKLVQPYILRRLKTDKRIISDLPDKTELNRYCGLSKVQTALYKKAVKELTEALKNDDITTMQRKGLVINYLLTFKQICNHPAQALGNGDYIPEQSGKFEALKTLCEEISERQEKVLIFTQFKEMTQPLAQFLATIFGQTGLILHGSTPVKARQKLVEAFQSEAGPPFFVLSLKAGGTGLNLTAANHVIHFDRWWNPAVENQATDRAFRIGQKRNVLVHKFICQGTVEENIDTLIANKVTLSNDILSSDGSPKLTELDDQALLNLVSLDVNKAQL